MIPGPVFEYELKTTARRGRYHVIRTAYGLLIFVLIGQAFYGVQATTPAEMRVQDVSRLALILFGVFVVFQHLMVLTLTPPLVAGVIADEKHRKTLHYLMASRLSSAEIVLGKLLARLLHVFVFLLVGFPVMSLFCLLGGVDPRLVELAFASAACSTFFLASLAILVSTVARRPRDALFTIYILELFWLFGIPLFVWRLPLWWPWLGDRLEPFNEWFLLAHPFASIYGGFFGPFGPPRINLTLLPWTFGIEVGSAGLFLLLAILLLRPTFMSQEGGRRRWLGLIRSIRRPLRLRRRPACGDRPVLWKELHTSRPRGISRWVRSSAGVLVGGLLLYQTYILAAPAFEEAVINGYRTKALHIGAPYTIRTGTFAPPADAARRVFNEFLRVSSSFLLILWIMSTATGAASGIPSEREGDTWISLTGTPLAGREILRAKMVGAIWGARKVGALIVLLWMVGLAAGAIHPVGVLLALLQLAVYTGFAATLGLCISTVSATTSRALFLTVAALVFSNVVGQTLFNLSNRHAPVLMPGSMPIQLYRSLFDYPAVDQIEVGRFRDFFEHWDIDPMPSWTIITTLISLVVFGTLGAALHRAALVGFRHAAGRPRLPKRPDPRRSSLSLARPTDDEATAVPEGALVSSLPSGPGE